MMLHADSFKLYMEFNCSFGKKVLKCLTLNKIAEQEILSRWNTPLCLRIWKECLQAKWNKRSRPVQDIWFCRVFYYPILITSDSSSNAVFSYSCLSLKTVSLNGTQTISRQSTKAYWDCLGCAIFRLQEKLTRFRKDLHLNSTAYTQDYIVSDSNMLCDLRFFWGMEVVSQTVQVQFSFVWNESIHCKEVT